MSRFSLTLSVVMAALVVSSAGAQSAPYRFDVLGETDFGSNRFAVAPAINDNGTAAFILPGPVNEGYTLHVGTPGAVQQVPTPDLFNRGGVSINNNNRVAFLAYAPQAQLEYDLSAYTVTPGAAPIVVINRLGMYGDISRELGISDDGRVMATVFATNAPPDVALIGDGTTTTEIARTISFLSAPRMSSAGDWAYFDAGGSQGPRQWITNRTWIDQGGVSFVYPGQSERRPFTAVGAGDVAANNWAVFNARWNNEPSELFTIRDEVIQPVPGARGLGGSVAINDNGTVAVLNNGPTTADPRTLYIFHADGPHRVLGEGDALLGSTVAEHDFAFKGFNNSDQFALLVGLADGRDVFVLASPVPEPGALGLTIITGAGLVLRRPRIVCRMRPR